MNDKVAAGTTEVGAVRAPVASGKLSGRTSERTHQAPPSTTSGQARLRATGCQSETAARQKADFVSASVPRLQRWWRPTLAAGTAAENDLSERRSEKSAETASTKVKRTNENLPGRRGTISTAAAPAKEGRPKKNTPASTRGRLGTCSRTSSPRAKPTPPARHESPSQAGDEPSVSREPPVQTRHDRAIATTTATRLHQQGRPGNPTATTSPSADASVFIPLCLSAQLQIIPPMLPLSYLAVYVRTSCDLRRISKRRRTSPAGRLLKEELRASGAALVPERLVCPNLGLARFRGVVTIGEAAGGQV